jgi:hypothetical protein
MGVILKLTQVSTRISLHSIHPSAQTFAVYLVANRPNGLVPCGTASDSGSVVVIEFRCG